MTEKPPSPTGLSPVQAADRIESLDVLRGFAVLGILIMNIQSFSMIRAAYINPAAYGDLTCINKWVWIIGQVLANAKFMTIFSALFGAGILLFWEKARSAGKRAGHLHYRRILWLLIIGLIHAYFFWYGDILVGYALCGIMVFIFRKARPGWLLFLGFCSMLVPFLIYTWGGMTIEFWPPESYKGSMESWLPAAESIQHELNVYLGAWLVRMKERAASAIFMETFYFLIKAGWHSGGIMLMGMALYKWDFLSARRSVRTYLASMVLGLVLGLPLIIYGVMQNFKHEWFHDYSMWFGSQFNYWGSLGISLAYISLIMLICKSGIMTGFRSMLSLVGRTALSNYLFQTLVCTFIFYGYGLGLFGKVERWQQMLIVPGVWVIQMVLTWIWMKKYRFGPAEWFWRSLTYRQIQPIRKEG
ncbi:MAG: hypothetical protein AMS26_16285 [Bacteroides sp. SM23_62]|nr:MAG: hypothetical protein AMS26_16285 [Bacteroides sp. SM23_62]